MADDAGPGPSVPANSPSTLLDLPEEIQKEIFGSCSQCDLICLSLACKAFRDLAAAQLYRNFHIVFPDDDDPAFDSPIDGLAGGLETFATSDYNYARHLRDMSLDTLSTGHKAETAYKPYLYNVSCGKFMNTLLLLTLRKAKSLDRFRWNIRVELSRPVYKALHDIGSLRHLHLRLQAGPSLYETPPPLPYSPHHPTVSNPPDSYTLHAADIPPPPPPPAQVGGVFSLSSSTIPYGPPPGLPPPPPPPPPPPHLKPPPPKTRMPKKSVPSKEPLTISGFKDLESLAVLDIDSLDVVPEIKECVQKSAPSLKKLKLSFSDALALQARRPCRDIDPEDSDQDDDFQMLPLAPSSSYNDADAGASAKVFRAQEERKHQESVLGRILNVEPLSIRKTPSPAESKETDKASLSADQRKRAFAEAVQKMSTQLAIRANGSAFDQAETLELVVKAARKYAEAEFDDQHDTSSPATASLEGTAGPMSSAEANLSTVNLPAQKSDGTTPTGEEEPSASKGLFDKPSPHVKQSDAEAKPEDIDVAAPEEAFADEAQDDSVTSTISSSGATPPITPPEWGSKNVVETADEPVEKPVSQAASRPVGSGDAKAARGLSDHEKNQPLMTPAIKVVPKAKAEQHEMNIVEAEINDAENPAEPTVSEKQELRQRVSEYARDTRGLSLHSLSLHLVPVKASVLGRAVDLRTLKKITLLNVGPQSPIWHLLAKENRLQPLPLRKIFTDNVTVTFLQFVSQLPSLEELFLLERSPKYKPESLAPKSRTTTDQIRRLVLKKHMPTLKRVMIKNKADNSWDIDEKTVQLICRRGKDLEELAVIMGIHAVHTFLRSLTGLVSLRALHIISFRYDDTCLSVMRETHRFIFDTVSHHPELKLEWISMGDDNHAEQIVRSTGPSKKPKKDKGKGKEPATAAPSALQINDPLFSTSAAADWNCESDSESGDDTGDDDVEEGAEPPSSRVKFSLAENVAFYDIWGVRIFKKEVWAGRL